MKRITVTLELDYKHQDGPEIGYPELSAKALAAAKLVAEKLIDTVPVIRWETRDDQVGGQEAVISHYAQTARVVSVQPNPCEPVELPSPPAQKKAEEP